LTVARRSTPRWAWAVTGSGHFLTESLAIVQSLQDVDLFISRAAGEVLRMYKIELELPKGCQVFRDTTASAAPVAMFYHGVYHTVVVAPATSNTVAKCVLGISDTLVTNVFAQAGKCRVPSIVFACDSAPEMETEAPEGMVKVYPRQIDLENTDRLASFERTEVVLTLEALRLTIAERQRAL
jgi:flavoprotein